MENEQGTPVLEPAETTPEVTVETTEETTATEDVTTSTEPTTGEVVTSLYTLPDGRQVDADTLQREWKENFLPDYTRKSQELAKLKQTEAPKTEDLPPWKQPGYVPKSYDELIEFGAQEALARQARLQAEEAQQRAQLEQQIDGQLAELKTIDPKLDENALFMHASKYGFRDLKTAHDNYRAMRDAVSQAEARAVQNVTSRSNTPVATPGAAAPVSTNTVDPQVTQKFGSAREFLASLTS